MKKLIVDFCKTSNGFASVYGIIVFNVQATVIYMLQNGFDNDKGSIYIFGMIFVLGNIGIIALFVENWKAYLVKIEKTNIGNTMRKRR